MRYSPLLLRSPCSEFSQQEEVLAGICCRGQGTSSGPSSGVGDRRLCPQLPAFLLLLLLLPFWCLFFSSAFNLWHSKKMSQDFWGRANKAVDLDSRFTSHFLTCGPSGEPHPHPRVLRASVCMPQSCPTATSDRTTLQDGHRGCGPLHRLRSAGRLRKEDQPLVALGAELPGVWVGWQPRAVKEVGAPSPQPGPPPLAQQRLQGMALDLVPSSPGRADAHSGGEGRC